MSEDYQSSVPDPNGPPRGIRIGKVVASLGGVGMIVSLGGVAAVLLLAATPSRTMGALRSHRVTWEDRKAQIAAVQAGDSAAADCAAETATPQEAPHD